MKVTKLLTALLLTALMLIFSVTAFAAERDDSVAVYVTVANGDLLLSRMPVTVTDIDSDGVLTVNDALTAAHNSYYINDGDGNGYAYALGDYGLYITKLWGFDASLGCGYYVNNISAMSLSDTISDNDEINAFLYVDSVAYSDMYCYFNISEAELSASESLTVTLSGAGFDENWNPIVVPVSNAVITVDGEPTEYKTDENGNATIKISEAGAHIVSASSEASLIVPPVCSVNITDEAPQTGFNTLIYIIVAAASLSLMAVNRKYAAKASK